MSHAQDLNSSFRQDVVVKGVNRSPNPSGLLFRDEDPFSRNVTNHTLDHRRSNSLEQQL